MISRTVYPSGEFLTAADLLASLLDSEGIFDSVTHESGSGAITCVNSGDTILSFVFSATSLTVAFYNHSGTALYELSGWTPDDVGVSTCNGVITVTAQYASTIVWAFSIGITKNQKVCFVQYANDTGVKIGCEYGTTYTSNVTILSPTKPWTRIAPVCFPAEGDGFEIAATMYGFFDKGNQITDMNPSSTGILPTIFSLEGHTYMTDGAFCFRDA